MASAAPATTWELIMMSDTVEPLLKGHLSTTATSYGTHGQSIHNYNNNGNNNNNNNDDDNNNIILLLLLLTFRSGNFNKDQRSLNPSV